MANNYTKLTVSPAIPCDLLCGLAGTILMSMLNHSQNVDEKTMYFYVDENIDTSQFYDNDLQALIEAEPDSPLAQKILALKLNEDDEFDFEDAGIDHVDVIASLVTAHPDKLPRIEIEGCFDSDRARPGEFGGFAHIVTPAGIRSIDTRSFLAVSPAGFDATKLTDAELTKCLDEMRRRGSAVAIYDVPEIMTMTDGWENQPTEDEARAWFDRDHMEEVMCNAARQEICSFVDNPEDHD